MGGALLAMQKKESRLSAAVAVVHKGGAIETFLKKPGVSVIEAWAQFPPEMGEDVFFGIDQEFIDGVDDPHHVKGGDWMAAIAVLRSGSVWVATGNQEKLAGKPSDEKKWEIFQLGQALKPNTWYRLKSEVDFGTRRYLRFTIEGPGLKKTLDLSPYPVDNPNLIPMNRRAMTYFVFAMRSRQMMKAGEGRVFFDDVSGSVMDSHGSLQTVFRDGFEETITFGDQPLTLPVIDLGNYSQGKWYKERQEALLSVLQAPFARTGRMVGVCDTNLEIP